MKITCSSIDIPLFYEGALLASSPGPMPVGPHLGFHSRLLLICVEYAITRAWVSGIGPLPVGERSLGRRGVEEADGTSNERGERDGGTGQPDVSEQSERWRLIDWFVGGRIISRTRTAPTHLMRAWSRLWHRFMYVYHGQYERPRPRAEISNVAISTVLTKARRVVASNGMVERSRGGSGLGGRSRTMTILFDEWATKENGGN